MEETEVIYFKFILDTTKKKHPKARDETDKEEVSEWMRSKLRTKLGNRWTLYNTYLCKIQPNIYYANK